MLMYIQCVQIIVKKFQLKFKDAIHFPESLNSFVQTKKVKIGNCADWVS